MPLGPAPTELSRYKQAVRVLIEYLLVSLDDAMDNPGKGFAERVVTEIGTVEITVQLIHGAAVRGTEWDR